MGWAYGDPQRPRRRLRRTILRSDPTLLRRVQCDRIARGTTTARRSRPSAKYESGDRPVCRRQRPVGLGAPIVRTPSARGCDVGANRVPNCLAPIERLAGLRRRSARSSMHAGSRTALAALHIAVLMVPIGVSADSKVTMCSQYYVSIGHHTTIRPTGPARGAASALSCATAWSHRPD